MAHTNETEKYGLSQFLATDKPAWLVDYNTDMMKIDMNMNGLQEQVTANLEEYHSGEGALDTRVTQCESDIVALDGRTTALEGRMDSAEGRLDVDEANIVSGTNRIGVLEGKVADLESGQGLANDSVDTDMLKDHCVTTDKLAYNSVTTDEILNGTIQYEDLSIDLVRHLINMMHPVGSVYLSMGVDPNTLFVGTTWVRQTGGVLYTGNGSNDGTTTGSNSKTLQTANLPSHSHTFSGGGSINTGDASWGSGTPSFKLQMDVRSSQYVGSDWRDVKGRGLPTPSGAEDVNYQVMYSGSSYLEPRIELKGGSWNHTHSVSVSGSIGNTGSGTAFDVQQAGIYVSVWKRTA